MSIDEKKLDVNELEDVSGGRIIEGKDGKFYVVHGYVPSFETMNDAKEHEKAKWGRPGFIDAPDIFRPHPVRPPFPKKPIGEKLTELLKHQKKNSEDDKSKE